MAQPLVREGDYEMSRFGMWNGVETGATLVHKPETITWDNNYSYTAQRENFRNMFNYQSHDWEWPVFTPYQGLY
jgi:hypothetical protein